MAQYFLSSGPLQCMDILLLAFQTSLKGVAATFLKRYAPLINLQGEVFLSILAVL